MLAPEGAWVEPLIARSRSEVMTYWNLSIFPAARLFHLVQFMTLAISCRKSDNLA
jgi:hypothetical protein